MELFFAARAHDTEQYRLRFSRDRCSCLPQFSHFIKSVGDVVEVCDVTSDVFVVVVVVVVARGFSTIELKSISIHDLEINYLTLTYSLVVHHCSPSPDISVASLGMVRLPPASQNLQSHGLIHLVSPLLSVIPSRSSNDHSDSVANL